MSYFDHVRCHACKAMLDPESLANMPGQGLTCPKCGAALSLTDLFGLADAYAEEDEAPVSFDDLVPGSPIDARPSAVQPATPTAQQPQRSQGRRPRSAAPPAKGGTALVRRPAPSTPADDEPAEGSALDAMRSLKRR